MADRRSGHQARRGVAGGRDEALSEEDLLAAMGANRNTGDGLDAYRTAIRSINRATSNALATGDTEGSNPELRATQPNEDVQSETATLGFMIGPLPVLASIAPTRGRQRANSNTMLDGPHRYDRAIQISPDRSGSRQPRAPSSSRGSSGPRSAFREGLGRLEAHRRTPHDLDDESDASEDTLRPPASLPGAPEDDEVPQQFPVPSFVVRPTRIFGREDDGTVIDPENVTREAGDSPFEQSVKLKRYEEWNAFCRFLNECRRWRRLAKGEPGDDPDIFEPREATAEDYLYQIFQRGEDDSDQTRLQRMILEEDMDFLTDVFDWFEVNSRQNWATQIMEGSLVAKLTVHKGLYDVHYIVAEENQQPTGDHERRSRLQLKTLVRLFPDEHAKAYQKFLDGDDHAFASALQKRLVEISASIAGPNQVPHREQEAARRREERRVPAELAGQAPAASSSSSSSSSSQPAAPLQRPRSESVVRAPTPTASSEQPRNESVVRAPAPGGYPMERGGSHRGPVAASSTSAAPSVSRSSSGTASEPRESPSPSTSTSSKGKPPVRSQDKKRSPIVHQYPRDRDWNEEETRGRQA